MINKIVESGLKSRTLDVSLCLSSGTSQFHCSRTQQVKDWLWWVAVQRVRAEGKLRRDLKPGPGLASENKGGLCTGVGSVTLFSSQYLLRFPS